MGVHHVDPPFHFVVQLHGTHNRVLPEIHVTGHHGKGKVFHSGIGRNHVG